jgi:thymidylate synthase (FAD)
LTVNVNQLYYTEKSGRFYMLFDKSKYIGKEFKVLDKGFIRIVDFMGDDSAIVQAARQSYSKGTKTRREDRDLIRYLMRHKHTSPFEMCEIKLHVRVPMDTWRQWIRHRTASVNEYSTRYSVAIDDTLMTDPYAWRLQSKSNRQGSEEFANIRSGRAFSKREREIQKICREVYQERLDFGIAREQARKDLPLSTYTEAYWKIDLHNLLHFLELRMADNAQYEIRQYANIIGYDIVRFWVPIVWEAFLDYRIDSVTFSESEIQLLKLIYRGEMSSVGDALRLTGWIVIVDNTWRFTLEAREFISKLERLGIDFLSSEIIHNLSSQIVSSG